MEEFKADLKGKVVVVTGANAGMGKETTRALAKMGATVVMACRSVEKAEAARRELEAEIPGAKLVVMPLDVSVQASIRGFADVVTSQYPKIDVLVNNAGAWWPDKLKSADGYELQWATNVLGPHLLTNLLLPALQASGRGRVVNVASSAASGLDLGDVQYEKRGYSGVKAYTATKQADRMLTWALAKRLEGTKVTANAVNPGLVATGLNRSTRGFLKVMFGVFRNFSKTAANGADTAVWASVAPELERVSGKFFENRKEIPCKFREPGAVERLWQLCEQQTRRPASSRAGA